MKRVNDLLIPDTRQGMFVTAVYAVLDMASKRTDLRQRGA